MARVPVYCVGNNSSYNNQTWYEKVKDIVQLNGRPIAVSNSRPPPVFRQGDSVVVRYRGTAKGKVTLYKGTVNFPVDAKASDRLSREGSSRPSSSATGHTSSGGSPPSTVETETADLTLTATAPSSTGADIQQESSVERQLTVRPSEGIPSSTDMKFVKPACVSSPLRWGTGRKESGKVCNPAKKARKAGQSEGIPSSTDTKSMNPLRVSSSQSPLRLKAQGTRHKRSRQSGEVCNPAKKSRKACTILGVGKAGQERGKDIRLSHDGDYAVDQSTEDLNEVKAVVQGIQSQLSVSTQLEKLQSGARKDADLLRDDVRMLEATVGKDANLLRAEVRNLEVAVRKDVDLLRAEIRTLEAKVAKDIELLIVEVRNSAQLAARAEVESLLSTHVDHISQSVKLVIQEELKTVTEGLQEAIKEYCYNSMKQDQLFMKQVQMQSTLQRDTLSPPAANPSEYCSITDVVVHSPSASSHTDVSSGIGDVNLDTMETMLQDWGISDVVSTQKGLTSVSKDTHGHLQPTSAGVEWSRRGCGAAASDKTMEQIPPLTNFVHLRKFSSAQ